MKRDDPTHKSQMIRLKKNINSGLADRHNRSKEKYVLHHKSNINSSIVHQA